MTVTNDNKQVLDFKLQMQRQDKSFPMLQVLNNDGEIVDEKALKRADLSDEKLVELMKQMVFSRILHERSMKLAKQGRLGFYAPTIGEEASQIASNFAFEKDDWVFPGYRDIPQLVMKGWPVYKAFLWSRGHYEGNVFEDVKAWMPQIIIGAQYVEAAGVALGLKKRNKPNVVYTYTGDGGTSQGDFYEGMNFAGAYKAPAVFFSQNNGFAISTPRSLQTAAPHLAAKGWAAGLPSMVVDGMDPIAMYLAAKEARQWAVDGNGPVFIETITNRLGAHSTSGDDPLRYRTQDDIDEWTAREPLIRFRKYLEGRKLWSEDIEEDWAKVVNEQIDDAVKQADGIEKQKVSDFIANTLEEPGQAAAEQIKKYEEEGK